MTTYVDTSALVPLYVPERFSANAQALVQQLPQVAYTPLHDLELTNALALLKGRGLITADQYRTTISHLEDDVDARRLLPVAVDWPDVFAAASLLAVAHTATWLTRSLDVLHVALAKSNQSRVFVSADDRQLAAAKAAGLKIVDIKKTSRLPRR